MSGWIDPSPMLRGSDWLLSLLVASSAKSAVVLAAAALSALVLRRGPAAWRHLAWTVAVTGSLCLPVVSAVLPDWRVPLATPWPTSPGLGSPPEALPGSQVGGRGTGRDPRGAGGRTRIGPAIHGRTARCAGPSTVTRTRLERPLPTPPRIIGGSHDPSRSPRRRGRSSGPSGSGRSGSSCPECP